MIRLRNYLKEKSLVNLCVDEDDILVEQKKIIKKKKLLKDIVFSYYRKFISFDELYFSGKGKKVELGAGTSLIKELFPEVVTTDIRSHRDLDCTIDSQDMNFKNESIRSILGVNCFHHFPKPHFFFKELQRVLIPGGGCVLIEPYFGIFSRWFFNRLHETEFFDMNQKGWTQEVDVMSKANQALSYIVFFRDKKEFNNKYPNLEVIHHEIINNTFTHLFSGGLNYKQLVPDFLVFFVKVFDFMLQPLIKYIGLHHIIVLRKTNNN